MSPETLILFNLQIYALGFLFFLTLNNSIFTKTSGWLSLLINTLGLIITSSILVNNPGVIVIDYKWIPLDTESITFSLIIDSHSRFMLIIIQVISCLVNLFSTKYLSDDPGSNRFFAYLNLFVLAMLGLVLAGNLFQLYFFWELVGLCSYLLIGFWYTKKSANAAAIKAFLLNKVGDAFLLAGIFLLYYLFGTFNFSDLTHSEIISRNYIFLSSHQLQTLAVILLFGGVMAKSAQLPLQVWLPDAMEGPTPASALIHAATMVVAGVFLLGRIQPIITPDAGVFIATTGALTSVIAALSALVQYDIKKVLAFSTISQLGFMVAGMGMGEMAASFFHLTTHAFFKAGLFLCAGAIISHLHHEQDMRKMGDLIQKYPVIFAAFMICAAGLMGLPLTGGFLSKESILNAAFIYGLGDPGIKLAIPVLLSFTSFLTTCYVIRQVVMVFFQREDSPMEVIIDTTKKTVGGALKSIQDLLTAEDKGKGEDKLIQFIRNMSTYDVVVICLAVCSLFIVYSKSPFHANEVWFFYEFGGIKEMYDWLLWLVGFLMISGLLISYNSTLEEIRRYYFNEPLPQWRGSLVNLVRKQFLLDRFYETSFRRLFFGKKNNGILAATGYIEKNWVDNIVIKTGNATLHLAKLTGFFEEKVIDSFVLGSFGFIKKTGNVIRNWGKGNIQLYITGLLIIAMIIMLFLIIL